MRAAFSREYRGVWLNHRVQRLQCPPITALPYALTSDNRAPHLWRCAVPKQRNCAPDQNARALYEFARTSQLLDLPRHLNRGQCGQSSETLQLDARNRVSKAPMSPAANCCNRSDCCSSTGICSPIYAYWSGAGKVTDLPSRSFSFTTVCQWPLPANLAPNARLRKLACWRSCLSCIPTRPRAHTDSRTKSRPAVLGSHCFITSYSHSSGASRCRWLRRN